MYQCSSARATYSNPKIKVVDPNDQDYHMDSRSMGTCVLDPEDYLIGSGSPPHIFYKRCDGTYRDAKNQRMR
ncbi:uncharacterized protein PpBr36_09556 [Pyricularia pennisetigena]|uniref:uncharacterized protein n=1 Tax=Pyricularia pennisetigena TaxID=1578925 RepID=UPI00115484CB|nr:uncharacterized protein PpBr36_09556 [Pyricularia pennisetigena]TLS21616.1 hypothetical protein PpBr36_09556 [Pyricularia pennisetigena]